MSNSPVDNSLRIAARCEQSALSDRAFAYKHRHNPVLGRMSARMAERQEKQAILWFKVAEAEERNDSNEVERLYGEIRREIAR